LPERDHLGRTIDVASTCAAWTEICPAAEELARGAAQLALVRGSAVLKLALRERVELGILLTDAAEQRRLNRNHRGVDAPTNVLAFPAWEPTANIPVGAPVLLGDVAFALETLAREASGQGKPIADHFRHLVVHGVLHLLGFDHSMPAEAEAMEALERSILAELGVPDPYSEPISLNENTSFQP
jgi:probable rRNA maturation factor